MNKLIAYIKNRKEYSRLQKMFLNYKYLAKEQYNKLKAAYKDIKTKLQNNNERQLRYLSQSAIIEEAVTPNIIQNTLIIIVSAIFLFLIWAFITEIDEVAVAPGEVVTKQYTQSIQHLEGGIIKKINFAEGELIAAGETLIELDGVNAKQNLTASKIKLVNLELKLERLKALVNETKPNFDNFISIDHNEIAEQLAIYENIIDSQNSELEVITQQIDQKEENLKILKGQLISLRKNLEIVENELNLKKQLFEKGALSKIQYFEISKEYNSLSNEVSEVESKVIQAINIISEYNKRLAATKSKFKEEAYKNLEETDSEYNDLKERVITLKDVVARLNIKSPANGLVKQLNIKTIGGVVKPSEIIAEILPLEGNLLIKSKLQPNDIGHVKIGQIVTVKILAYDFTRYGVINGKVAYISPSTIADPDGKRYYKVKVELDKNYVGNNPKKHLIIPGMMAQADIKTGKKSILAYLFKPIHSSLDSAFTER